MAYDEGLAERLREVYAEQLDLVEKKMFGGLAFMVSGHMSCGVVDDRLMVRVGADQYQAALQQAHTGEMDFTGKPLRGFIYVEAAGLESDQELREWVEKSLRFVNSLPPK